MNPGELFAECYLILEKLNDDQAGNKYTAEDQRDHTQVFLKTLSAEDTSDADTLSRFAREAELARSVKHDNILNTIDSGEYEDTLFLATEYEEGIHLDDLLNEQGPMLQIEALNTIKPIACALEHVWNAQNIVHRGISPTSILITDDNQIKLSGFEVAKASDAYSLDLTTAGFSIGNPQYMSPEQTRAEENLNFHSDMYSLGLVIYEILTGAKAYTDTNPMRLMSKQLNDPLPNARDLRPAITEDCIAMLSKMCAKNISDRYPDWASCITAIETAVTTAENAPTDPEDLNATCTDDPSIYSSGIIAEDEEQPEAEIGPGTFIGNGYEIDSKIGSASLGDIYLAYNDETSQLVRIKVLPASMHDDPERVERFFREMKISEKLKHDNLLTVLESGEDAGRHYIVNEYAEGLTLQDHIGRYGPLDEKQSLQLVSDIASVLDHAWQQSKLIHRDIKPQNVLITKSDTKAKLMDFGIAKELEDENNLDLTGAGFTIGTPEYMSPEQCRAEENLDFHTDMYSLGLTLYECVTKQKAFEDANPMKLMQKQLNENPTAPSKVNPKLSSGAEVIILTMLAKDASDRFTTWQDFFNNVNQVLVGESTVNSSTKEAQDISTAPTETRIPDNRAAIEAEAAQLNNKDTKLIFIIAGVVILLIILALILL